jgi:xanthine dehydrogenase accessory factor
MLVWAGGQWGTIGGGNLEHQATIQARRMLEAEAAPAFAVQDYPLGPFLAQCCGGRVRLIIERLGRADAVWLTQAACLAGAGQAFELRVRLGAPPSRDLTPHPGPDRPTVGGRPAEARGPGPASGDEIATRVAIAAPRVRLFGAGHVGQAIAHALAPLPFRLEWWDTRPDVAAETSARLVTPEALACIAAKPAPFRLILTHDHALDYALVQAALTARGDGYIGLIGSRTKRARFSRRLRDDGVGEAALARLVCPIGIAGLTGKAPEIIAASVAADLLIRGQAMARKVTSETALARL